MSLSFLGYVRLTSRSHIYLSKFLHRSQLQLLLNTGTSSIVRKRVGILIGIRNKCILDDGLRLECHRVAVIIIIIGKETIIFGDPERQRRLDTW
jgi:hypothetical protein